MKFFERGYKYLFWINNFLWKKKIFAEKNKFFLKIIHIFFLENIIIFRVVLLHLNNHRHRGWLINRRLLTQPKRSFTGWERLELCIMTALILKVTISSLFQVMNTFTAMFGSANTTVLFSVTVNAIFSVWLNWPDKFRARFLYYS